MDTPIISTHSERPSSDSTPQKNSLEKISFIVFLISIILTPLVFLPTSYAPLDMSKTVVISFGVLISSILYFISAFKQKSLVFPKHPLVFVSAGIIVSTIISTFLSSSILKSFFGQGFELTTASLTLIFFLTALLTIYLTYKERDRILYVYGGIIISFLVLALFHVIRFIGGPETLNFGLFQYVTSTLVGKWNDLALFAGVIGLISYTGLQFITLNRLFKTLLTVLLLISGAFLAIVNSSAIWTVVAVIMLAIVYSQFASNTSVTAGSKSAVFIKRLPVLSVIILLIAGVFAWKGDVISAPVINALKIEQAEVPPLPWQHTLDIASDTLKESPIFGSGPNRFVLQYLKFKPQAINSSVFWNTEFNNGSGVIPSSLVTTGFVGFLLWCAFLVVLGFAGFKSLVKTKDDFSRFFIGSTFFTALFLWIASIVHVPSHSVSFIMFIVTGLFISSLISEGYASMKKIESAGGSKFGKFAPALAALIIVVCAVWGFAFLKKTVALGYFQGGITALNLPQGQGLDKAQDNFKKALSWDMSDIYYQALSEVNILKITMLSQQLQAQAQQGAKTPDEASVNQIAKLVEEAVGYTKSAVAVDPMNYYNYVSEARISEIALSLKIENAFENTKTAYENALKNNPYNPALYLSLARIYASQEKFPEAQQYIGTALQLKQNYIEAIFLLSQIQVSQGQIKEAITSVQVASQINPDNPLIYFQLGLLHYNNKSYQDAVTAFGKAVELNSQYANAQYFLGLSYARLGQTTDALEQFEKLAETNPDSEEVALIISNLKSGKSPFADAQPPIDSKPEKRTNLPVKEKAVKK